MAAIQTALPYTVAGVAQPVWVYFPYVVSIRGVCDWTGVSVLLREAGSTTLRSPRGPHLKLGQRLPCQVKPAQPTSLGFAPIPDMPSLEMDHQLLLQLTRWKPREGK